MTGFRLDVIAPILYVESPKIRAGPLHKSPVVLRGVFTVSGEPMDTYLNTNGWGKGVAFVNGHNLGRYWPLVGPQVTLYVPAPFLKEGTNELVLVELEYVPSSRRMKLEKQPILDFQSKQSNNADNPNISVSV